MVIQSGRTASGHLAEPGDGERRVRIGDKNRRTLPAPKTGSWVWWDSSADVYDVPRGFGVRVTARGVRSYVVKYRVGGRQRVATLGRVEDMGVKAARDLARQYRNAAREGIDRLAEERKLRQESRLRGNTLAEMIDRYLADPGVQALRTYAEYGRLLRQEVVFHLGHLKPDEVTKGHVRALVRGIAEGTLEREHARKSKAPFIANRVLSVLQAMYGWAVKNDLLERAPGWPEPPAREVTRDRVLTEDEVRVVWMACQGEEGRGNLIGSALKLMLLTGQRRGEVLRMRWLDISEEEKGTWWTIPAEYTKNGRDHRVPLTRSALDVVARARRIAEQRGIERSEWVFPGDGRPSAREHVVTPSHGWERVLEAARLALDGEGKDGAGVVRLRMHDLRRTAVTGMASAGIPDSDVARVVNHTARTGAPRVTAIYNRYSYDKEKRVALEAWERRLGAILAGQREARTVPITAARR